MTTFRFLCAHCKSKLSADLSLRSEACGCPKCGRKVVPLACTPLDIRFLCPDCSTPLLVDRSARGRSIRCPKCSAKAEVPNDTAEPPSGTEVSDIKLSEEEIAFLTA